jgi:hypothetical protein
LNLHVHFHTLVLDEVFVREADDTLRFCPAAPPTGSAALAGLSQAAVRRITPEGESAQRARAAAHRDSGRAA